MSDCVIIHCVEYFSGVHQMGLFWSLKPRKDEIFGTMLAVRDVTRPIRYRLGISPGHTNTSSFKQECLLDTVDIERRFIHPAVERQPVRCGNIRGTLFYPKG